LRAGGGDPGCKSYHAQNRTLSTPIFASPTRVKPFGNLQPIGLQTKSSEVGRVAWKFFLQKTLGRESRRFPNYRGALWGFLCFLWRMVLELLPTRAGGAAENMATDFLLLQRYPRAIVPRFRHYGWHRPAFTFGYSQKIAFVREALPAGGGFDLSRRATGGGIVDHRDDWTYALVIPRGHPLEEIRATTSYREVHEALAGALRAQVIPATTKPRVEAVAADPSGPGICFQRAEIFDVVHGRTGEKIAGAAQKRNKHGLLFQGSVWKPAAGGDTIDWEKFHHDFAANLARALGGVAAPAAWPDFNDDELSALVEQYSSPEWLDAR
jgi:lipoyl(octanoyl) transferase